MREQIISRFLKAKSNAAKPETRVRQDFQNAVAVVILSSTTQKEWRDVLDDARDKHLELYPGNKKIVDNIVEQLQRGKCRKAQLLTAKAYSWLDSMLIDPDKKPEFMIIDPDKKPAWYPDKAVEVAHEAFRLPGKVESFRRYLSDNSRKKVLQILEKVKRACFLSSCAQVVFMRIKFLPHAV